MGYGCITCLSVIENISHAFHLDLKSGPGGIPLRVKLLDLIPNLVVNINNACLCQSCLKMVSDSFDFKLTALESRNKIISFLQQAPNADVVGVDDIAKQYGVKKLPILSDYEVHFKPEVDTSVQTFDNVRYEQAPQFVQDDQSIARWEPPLPLDVQNDDQPVFQSPPVINSSEERRKLKCRLCDYSCDENCMHAFHMILHESPKPPYSCGRCPAQLFSREQLLDHLARHTGETPYQCTVCFFQTNRYQRMKIHQDTHLKPFYCSMCKERFRMEKEMKMHVAEAHRGKLKCYMCKYQAKDKILLRQHQRDHLMCRTCGAAFPDFKNLTVHCQTTGHKKKFGCI